MPGGKHAGDKVRIPFTSILTQQCIPKISQDVLWPLYGRQINVSQPTNLRTRTQHILQGFFGELRLTWPVWKLGTHQQNFQKSLNWINFLPQHESDQHRGLSYFSSRCWHAFQKQIESRKNAENWRPEKTPHQLVVVINKVVCNR